MSRLCFLCFIFVIFTSSCVRTYMVKTDSNRFEVQRVNLLAIQYHRPSYAPAEQDDFSVKNRELECQSPAQLYSEILTNSKEVNECLNSIQAGSAIYFYTPDVQPYLQFDTEDEDNPKCLGQFMPKIPLPREIYYLGAKVNGETLDDTELECYASSFGIKTNQILKTPTSFLKKKIKIDFPLDRPLNHSQDLRLWLTMKTFLILKSDDDSQGRLFASPVPDGVCSRCFKSDPLFQDKYRRKIKPVFWP